jgi:hypothetical protein
VLGTYVVDPNRETSNYFNASIKDFSQNFAAGRWMSPNATTFVRAAWARRAGLWD